MIGPIRTSCRCRGCRSPRPAAGASCANLSGPFGDAGRALRRRWRHRHHRAADRRSALQAARPELRGREPHRRRHAGRHHRGGEGGAGRLHAAGRAQPATCRSTPACSPSCRTIRLRDFVPVAMLANYPFLVVVNNDLPVKSIKELVAYLKANPGKVDYASAGNGTGQHLAPELFKMVTGTDMKPIHYQGAQPAYLDVISGRVPVFFDNMSTAMSLAKEGKVRALAITSKKRSPLMPELPTVEEAGVPGYEYHTWFGLLGAEGHAAGGDRQARRRDEEGARRSGHPAEDRRRRRRAGHHGAQGDRSVREGRDRQMGRGGQARRHQGGIGRRERRHRPAR